MTVNTEEIKTLSCTSSEGIVDDVLRRSCVSSALLIDLCEERHRFKLDDDDSKFCNLQI